MGGGGGSTYDYHNEVQQGLQQANQPKSDLAQQLSGLFGNILAGQGNGNGMVPPTPGQTQQGQTGFSPNDSHPNIPLGGPMLQMSPSDGPNTSSFPSFPQGFNPLGPAAATPQGNNPQSGGGLLDHWMNMINQQQGQSASNVNPFTNLMHMTGGSQVNPVFNSGNMDPRLASMFPQQGSNNPLTQNAGTALSQGPAGLNLGSTNSLQQQLQQNVNGPQLNSVSGIDPAVLQQLMQGINGPQQSNINTQLNPSQVNTQGANLSGIPQAQGLLQNTPYADAVQQILGNKQNQDIADLRARFGAGGGASRGTPAQYAEATLRAQQTPEIAAALGNIRQQEAGLDLGNRQLQSSNLLQNAGLGLQGQQSNQQAGLQAQQIGGQLGLQQNALNQQAGITTNQQNLDRLTSLGGLGVQNAGLGVQQRGQDLTGAISGLDNSTSRLGQSAGLQANLLQTLLGQQGQGLQNSQFNAGQYNSQGLANRGLTLQDLLQQNQYSLGAGGLNSQNAQFNASQNNQLGQNYQQQLQASQESALGRNANAQNQLAAYIAQIAALGYPGGSANINVSPIQNNQGSGLGGTLAGLGQLAQGVGAVKNAWGW